MGINQFTDLTYLEFSERYLNKFPSSDFESIHKKQESKNDFILHKHKNAKISNQSKFLQTKSNRFAKGIDLREEGLATSVRNQGQCGSCAIFASIAAIEAVLWQATAYLQELSEQYLLDCANNYSYNGWQAQGCSGSWPLALLGYVVTHSGVVPIQKDYPYEGKEGQCRFNDNMARNVNGRIDRMSQFYNISIDQILNFLDSHIPVIITLLAGSEFYSYASGVISAKCSDWTQPDFAYRANHAVAIIGYGRDESTGLDYFLIKNSWGSTWGNRGFAKIDATMNDPNGSMTRGYISLRYATMPISASM